MERIIVILSLLILANYANSQDSFVLNKYNDIAFSFIQNQNYTSKANATSNFFIKSIASISPTVIATTINYKNSSPQNEFYNIRSRTIISGALFTTTFATGYWLSATEKPYNKILLMSHKLSTLSNIALIDITLFQKRKHFSLSNTEKISAIIMNICFVSTIATGGMLSTDKTMPKYVHTFHKTTPWLTLASSVLLLFLLNK